MYINVLDIGSVKMNILVCLFEKKKNLNYFINSIESIDLFILIKIIF